MTILASRRSYLAGRAAAALLLLSCGAAALSACKKKEGPAAGAAPSVKVAERSCDRRVAERLCVEYLGAAATEAYVKKECAATKGAAYRPGACPAGSIGRCMKFIGGPSELHELHYQGNFEAVKKLCESGGGAWKLTP